jgi:hypothetical protein
MLVCTDGQYDDTIDGWSDSDGRKVRRRGASPCLDVVPPPSSLTELFSPRAPSAVQVCTKIAQNKTKCAVKEFQGFANMTGVARSRDMYWFVLVNCNQTKIDVEVRSYQLGSSPALCRFPSLCPSRSRV